MPIVEPELLIDGSHDQAAFAAASERVISRCVAHLWQKVRGWAAGLLGSAGCARLSEAGPDRAPAASCFRATPPWSCLHALPLVACRPCHKIACGEQRALPHCAVTSAFPGSPSAHDWCRTSCWRAAC